MLPRRDPPQMKDVHSLKMKGWKKIFQAKRQEKYASSNTYIRQNTLQNRAIKGTQKDTS